MKTGSRQIIANCSFPTSVGNSEDPEFSDSAKARQASLAAIHNVPKSIRQNLYSWMDRATRAISEKEHLDAARGHQVAAQEGFGDEGLHRRAFELHTQAAGTKNGFGRFYVPGNDSVLNSIPPGTPPQRGYDQWRNEIGSGQNQYPTGDQASPSEPQPLDEWEQDALRTGDSPEKAPKSGWEDKRGGKGQQRPGKRPASRYQQPFGDQDVGQGMGDREGKNFGPLEF